MSMTTNNTTGHSGASYYCMPLSGVVREKPLGFIVGECVRYIVDSTSTTFSNVFGNYDNEKTLLNRIETNSTSFTNINCDLQCNKQFVLEAVRVNGLVLEYALQFQNDEAVVIAAVANKVEAFKFASHGLQTSNKFLQKLEILTDRTLSELQRVIGIDSQQQEKFPEIREACYQWAIHSEADKKEIKCTLEGVDVTIIFTRMVWTKNKEEIKIPNRINVSSDDSRIKALFKKYLWQTDPAYFPNWDKRLWVFRNDPNVLLSAVQYELRFFQSEELLRSQLADDVKSKADEESRFCIIA